MNTALFDSWTDRYDAWFDTPVGKLIRSYEAGLLMELLAPDKGDFLLDAGCGTGIFTCDVLASGASVSGIDLSFPMVKRAKMRATGSGFYPACSDMNCLPFADDCFDRVFSMTAIEFVEDARKVIAELERVTKKGGVIVVSTLNSLSPWAERRKKKADQGHDLFKQIYFRSPEEMKNLIPAKSVIKTAIHFPKDAAVQDIPSIEAAGHRDHPETGAFLAVRWQKA